MSTKVLPVANLVHSYKNSYCSSEVDSRSSSPGLHAENETDFDSSSDSEVGCSPPMRAQIITFPADLSVDSELDCSPPMTTPTHCEQMSLNCLGSPESFPSTSVERLVVPETSSTLEQSQGNVSLSSTFSNFMCLPKTYQHSVMSKFDSSAFYKFRFLNRELSAELSRWRKHYPVKQPVYRLELNGEDTVYLTGHKTRRTVPFKLCEANKYELLKVEPEYLNVFTHVFGSKTSRLMKKHSSAESTDEWKNLCRFVMSQVGLNMDSDGNVTDDSKMPDSVVVMRFGAKVFPFKLVENCLQKWNCESTTLAELDVSFKEKLADKEKMAEQLLSGFKFKKVWSPSSHQESLFCDAELWEYEEWLQRKHSATLEDDPVLLYAALSNDKEKLAVLVVADHAVQLSFCYLEDNGALLELRDRFMEVTKSEDLECVSDYRLNKMLKQLGK